MTLEEKEFTSFPTMSHDDFQKEYQCDFKSNIEIMHYDDVSADIKYQIHLDEFGNDRGYVADCVVIKLHDNGTQRVSYYANLNDFIKHPKWDESSCYVVCFDEKYKRNIGSETK
ncbi:hypothetical protein [Sulfuricurvum sp.]|uniref:hypothetical protein n=1 Tax=Sulfuricurvum sp. TaxID=2025608 RepID=UPI002D55C84B|nr:hypothetical protein [Sulfuricurvum sp.]HZF69846.1 hypothetical protein [Sulfuricurvum sp.]